MHYIHTHANKHAHTLFTSILRIFINITHTHTPRAGERGRGFLSMILLEDAIVKQHVLRGAIGSSSIPAHWHVVIWTDRSNLKWSVRHRKKTPQCNLSLIAYWAQWGVRENFALSLRWTFCGAPVSRNDGLVNTDGRIWFSLNPCNFFPATSKLSLFSPRDTHRYFCALFRQLDSLEDFCAGFVLSQRGKFQDRMTLPRRRKRRTKAGFKIVIRLN